MVKQYHKVRLNITISNDAAIKLSKFCTDTNINPSRAIDFIILKALKKYGK